MTKLIERFSLKNKIRTLHSVSQKWKHHLSLDKAMIAFQSLWPVRITLVWKTFWRPGRKWLFWCFQRRQLSSLSGNWVLAFRIPFWEEWGLNRMYWLNRSLLEIWMSHPGYFAEEAKSKDRTIWNINIVWYIVPLIFRLVKLHPNFSYFL